MTTAIPDVMTRQATVESATLKEGRNGAPAQWTLRLLVADISKFSFPCFLSSEHAAQVFQDSVHTVTLRRGKQKEGKAGGEGRFASNYQWDLTHWDVQAPTAQQVSRPLDPDGQPAKAGSPAPQSSTPGPSGQPWDAADTQSRISWAQAVNLGVEAVGPYDESEANESERPSGYLARVDFWANRFYPLIRKGPTVPDPANPTEEDLGFGEEPEPLFPDAPQSAQEPRNDGPAARKPFPVQGEWETAFNYMERVAQEVYGKNRDQMLKDIGGNWPSWEVKHGTPQAAVQAAIGTLELKAKE